MPRVILVSAVVEFLMILLFLFFGEALFVYLGLLPPALIAVLSVRLGGSNKHQISEGYQDVQECNAEYTALQASLDEKKQAESTLRRELERHKSAILSFGKNCVRMNHTADIEKKLSQVINQKTETATLELTNHVYRIGEWSKKVENLIQTVLGRMTSEQGGLRTQIRELERELARIEKLIEEFRRIKDDYISELETTESSLKAVDSFTDTITELAERTNVLAINASIEAARAGQAGRGFAVIASEIQGLAGNTMKIAEEISRTVDHSVRTVKESITNYGERLHNAVEKLVDSGTQHAGLIEQFGPQVDKIAEVVEESQRLSAEVTESINQVTVHLQYQDSVRQILEHMVQLIEEIAQRGKNYAEKHQVLNEVDAEQEYQEIMNIAKELFTTREEWQAFGYQLEEDLAGQRRKGENEHDLEGDVTLF